MNAEYPDLQAREPKRADHICECCAASPERGWKQQRQWKCACAQIEVCKGCWHCMHHCRCRIGSTSEYALPYGQWAQLARFEWAALGIVV